MKKKSRQKVAGITLKTKRSAMHLDEVFWPVLGGVGHTNIKNFQQN